MSREVISPEEKEALLWCPKCKDIVEHKLIGKEFRYKCYKGHIVRARPNVTYASGCTSSQLPQQPKKEMEMPGG